MILQGMWFWFAFIALVVVIGVEVIWERSALALVTMVAGAFCLWWAAGAFSLLPWLRNNWDTVLFVAIAHVVIGGIWSILNWRLFFLPDMYEKYEEDVKNWTWQYNNWTKPAFASVESYVADCAVKHGYPPRIADHKQDFFYWMWWWEIHAFWTLSHKPIQRISRWFYNTVSAMLDRMSINYWDKRKTNG